MPRTLFSGGLAAALALVSSAAPASAQFVKAFGSTGLDDSYAVFVDRAGNTYVTGHFLGTVDFDADNAITGDTKTSVGSNVDAFLAKYNSAGTLQFVKTFGSTSPDVGYGVAVDAFGSMYVSGTFSGTVDFDLDNTIAGDTKASVSGGQDAFLAKYNSSGRLQFVKAISGSGNSDVGNAVFVDGSGNAYVAGQFQGTVDFDADNTITGDTKTSVSSSLDAFMVKYNDAGRLQFVKAFGSAGNDIGYSAAVDGSGNVYVSGYFSGTVDFDLDNTVTGDTKTSAGSSTIDAFLAKYNSSGTLQFVKTFGAANSDAITGVATDGSGNAYVTGQFQGTVDFDADNTIAGDTKTANSGGINAFLAKYNSSGTLQFVKAFGSSTGTSHGNDVAIDAFGNVYVTGYFAGTVDFDIENTISGDTRLANGTGTDAFLAKYNSASTLQFVKAFGASNSDLGNDVAVDGSANIYVTGQFRGTVDFDPDNGTSTAADTKTSSGPDGFLVKYRISGALAVERTTLAALTVAVRGTSVRFAVRETQPVHADLYNAMGQHVATLFEREAQASETYAFTAPAGLTPGVYVVRLAGRRFSESARLVVAR
jgi:hypothetical protein